MTRSPLRPAGSLRPMGPAVLLVLPALVGALGGLIAADHR